jgi:hypothetical protein
MRKQTKYLIAAILQYNINQKPTVEAPEYFMDGYLDEEDDL